MKTKDQSTFTKRAIVLFIAVIGAFTWLMSPSPQSSPKTESPKVEANKPQDDWTPVTPETLRRIRQREAALLENVDEKKIIETTKLMPRPMQLAKKVLTQSKWNDGENAFTREVGHEAATIGPAAVAYDRNGNSYVLDTLKGRILGYDKFGTLTSTVSLPTRVASDLVVNPRDGSLLVVDHFNNTIYKVSGDKVTVLEEAEMKMKYPLGTQFAFDPETGSVVAQDSTGLADIKDGNLILGKDGEKPFEVTFDLPVECVEEAITDAKGNVWVLFTLEGDRKMRRVARINPRDGSVGVTEIDVWWAFDITRRMTPTEDGIVIIAGDNQQARLLAFDYAGTL